MNTLVPQVTHRRTETNYLSDLKLVLASKDHKPKEQFIETYDKMLLDLAQIPNISNRAFSPCLTLNYNPLPNLKKLKNEMTLSKKKNIVQTKDLIFNSDKVKNVNLNEIALKLSLKSKLLKKQIITSKEYYTCASEMRCLKNKPPSSTNTSQLYSLKTVSSNEFHDESGLRSLRVNNKKSVIIPYTKKQMTLIQTKDRIDQMKTSISKSLNTSCNSKIKGN